MNFKRLFFGGKDVFGLDIGSSCVKVVHLRQEADGYTIASAERVEIVQNVIADHGKVDNIIKAIRKCIKSSQIKTRYAVCGLSGPDVAARCFKFPGLRAGEINNAVLFEAEHVCPFDHGQFIVDYQVIDKGNNDSKNNDQIKGVLVASTADAIGRKSRLARAAYINCVLMDVEGLALLNCFSHCEKSVPGETTAILDVGSKFTNLAILRDDKLPFVRDIFHAADEIVDHIASESDISSQAVRDNLYSRQDKAQDSKQLTDSLETACANLVTDITETLRYHFVQHGHTVDKILVCGGFANANGFIEFLDSKLSAEVILWNPLSKMKIAPKANFADIIEQYGPSLVVAAGLAMRTI